MLFLFNFEFIFHRFTVNVVLENSNIRFILKDIKMSFTISKLKDELFKCYKIEPTHVSFFLSDHITHVESDRNTLKQCKFHPNKDFLVMKWRHPFWDGNTIYGINMKEMIFFDTGKNDQFFLDKDPKKKRKF